MSEPKAETSLSDPGMTARSVPSRRMRGEWLALGLSLLWLALVGMFWWLIPGAGGLSASSLVMTVVGIVLPVGMIWMAAVMARTAQEMRAEAQALKASLEAMRAAWATQGPLRSDAGQALEKKLDEVAIAARQAETALATFSSRRDHVAVQPSADRKAALVVPRSAPMVDDQPALALGTPAEDLAEPVSVADFIRAMQFPDNAEDKEGFRALRRALEDRTMAKLLRAAQDVLNLLAQDGIYMDDLKPDRARPELWRRFAKGERGREIAALGGVRDRSSLALTAGRMRTDTIFRDAAHHFLRQFDRTFTEFEQNATDQDVTELAETRTARAFMLLGRVTGTFD
ncbi:hypothetical protein [Rhodobacter maris]|uniref:Uncharacterized protein n=1 Tax=Rhodobacter maris TaxID=446682 RepID=A0A285T5T7_9RHOB|nr:hypothetical protein [Rhodobacter maris]SOC16192.1 hypothetical protein SAMN05877831_11435 [Rhodobacter maris]